MLIPVTASTVKRALSSLKFVKHDLSSPVTPWCSGYNYGTTLLKKV